MQTAQLDKMGKGWFVGDFDPTMYRSKDVEVAVKYYSAGDREQWHYHRVATELTVIVSGTVRMNGQSYHEGDAIMMEPGEGTDFEAVTDAVNVVVKLPCVKNDKFLRGE